MSESSSGPGNPVERVVEKVTGTAKEAAGTITGNEELRREGEEQEQAAMAGPQEVRERPGREQIGREAEEQGTQHPGPARPTVAEDFQ
ncbi:MAG: CsbD family protein [Nitriliruptorales bacterium]